MNREGDETSKKYAYTLLFSTALLSANVYVLLKTFVIPSAVTKVAVARRHRQKQAK